MGFTNFKRITLPRIDRLKLIPAHLQLSSKDYGRKCLPSVPNSEQNDPNFENSNHDFFLLHNLHDYSHWSWKSRWIKGLRFADIFISTFWEIGILYCAIN